MTKIIAASKRMFDLIKNFLDINAIEQGGLRITLTPANVSLVTQMTTHNYFLKAQSKAITLVMDTGNELFGLVDESILVQVLDNLVSNAVKFSPSNRNIYVRVKENRDTVRIEVQDEGPGISDADQKKLFGKFARLSAHPTAGESSTGLGLSIVKTMVEAMNGKIWCESKEGFGAAFIMEFPLITEASYLYAQAA
jgi:signal transduction histidine kinase